MSIAPQLILEQMENPEALEELYQKDPGGFIASLEQVSTEAPESLVLRCWKARLNSEAESASQPEKDTLWSAITIAVAVGLVFRLPANWLNVEWYYSRFGPLTVIMGPIAYYLLRNGDKRLIQITAGLAATTAAYIIFLPNPEASDSAAMALIHVPVMFAIMLGTSFLGNFNHRAGERTRFLSYLGELVVLTVVLGLGGLVLSGITIGLFSLIGLDIEDWYMGNIGIACAAAVPVGGTYLFDSVLRRKITIAPALARVFSPLFLVMVTAYLIAAIAQGQNPFIDRGFLIIFNGLLLLVLGITIFSLVGRKEPAVGWLDYVNVVLVSVTLAINSVALLAILFRLVSFGFTPNRVVVLGANITILVHLVQIFRSYLNSVKCRDGFPNIDTVIGQYLPIYSVWAATVLFIFPPLFGFK